MPGVSPTVWMYFAASSIDPLWEAYQPSPAPPTATLTDTPTPTDTATNTPTPTHIPPDTPTPLNTPVVEQPKADIYLSLIMR